ncbi:RHS repeat-associated core domain-containing protein [Chloroflexota bacterium]
MITFENGTKYYPYGYCRNSQPEIDNFPTDKLFTGQRRDSTGLYFYNARYYDPAIGRFISPDIIVPNPMTPQSFNRYSYVLNNPLKYADPSGRDYIFVGGNARNNREPGWVGKMKDALGINESGEKCVFIGDTDGFFTLRSGDQKTALAEALASGEYTDIKVIGYSEGAAATAMVLNDIAGGASYDELDMAFMLDTPDIGIQDFDSSIMDNLPSRVAKKDADIRAVSITSSDFVFSSKQGWESGDYSVSTDDWYDPWLEFTAYAIDPWVGLAATVYNQVDYHVDLTTDYDTYDIMMEEMYDYYFW